MTLHNAIASLAQLVERKTFNLVAAGSSPVRGIHFFFDFGTGLLQSLTTIKLSARSKLSVHHQRSKLHRDAVRVVAHL